MDEQELLDGSVVRAREMILNKGVLQKTMTDIKNNPDVMGLAMASAGNANIQRAARSMNGNKQMETAANQVSKQEVSNMMAMQKMATRQAMPKIISDACIVKMESNGGVKKAKITQDWLNLSNRGWKIEPLKDNILVMFMSEPNCTRYNPAIKKLADRTDIFGTVYLFRIGTDGSFQDLTMEEVKNLTKSKKR